MHLKLCSERALENILLVVIEMGMCLTYFCELLKKRMSKSEVLDGLFALLDSSVVLVECLSGRFKQDYSQVVS